MHHLIVLVIQIGLILILVAPIFLDAVSLLLLDHHDVARHVRLLILHWLSRRLVLVAC